MVGVSVVSASMPLPMETMKGNGMAPPKLPRGAARDLYRMICALSGACERDAGVLRDGALVDNLELQAKRILRARRKQASLASSAAASSSVLGSKTPVPVGVPSKMSKRRKLPAADDTYDKPLHSYGYDKSHMPFKSLANDDKASLYMARGDGSASKIPSVKIGKIEPYVAAMAGDVVVNSVAVSGNRSPSMSPIHMDHLPLVKPTAGRSSHPSLDLGASMASTVSSYSMQHYDMSDNEDGASSPLTPSARYASTHTPYDFDHYASVRGAGRRSDSYGEERSPTPSSDLDESFSGPSRRKGSCYSDASTASLGDRTMSKKLRFEMYEETSLKNVESGLVETLQSQVDLLLTENVKAMSENARLEELSKMSSSEAEAQAMEKRQFVEQVKEQSEQIQQLEQKYLDTKQRADAQEDFRREAEVAFQSELDTKAKLVATLQTQVTMKDEEIGRLSKRVEDISGVLASKVAAQGSARVSLTRSSSVGPSLPKAAMVTSNVEESELLTSLRESNLFMDMELERMRTSLLEKDREICDLYMHLSTKKKLIDEITKKFVQHMEEAAATAKAANSPDAPVAGGLSTDGVRFDLDMFLFKNVVDKQRRMEELTAALGVMDREVESLEARVADKERVNTQLRENQEFLTRSLQMANAQMYRLQAEKDKLGASAQESEARITVLVDLLEGKDRKVEHLTEQVDLRQMQIDQLLSSDTKAAGRRSLKNSFVKGRSSLSSSAIKSEEPRGSIPSGARRSSVTTMRSSLDWTDAHRPIVVMAQREELSKTKRSSVFSDVFNDIASPISDDEDSVFGVSMSDTRSTRANYRASEINDDEELFNELFAKA